MLLTNIAVAQQVAVHFPEQAMLRRHDVPIERRIVRLDKPLLVARSNISMAVRIP